MSAHIVLQRCFEFRSNYSSKFWTVRILDLNGVYSVQVHFGAIGTKGQTRKVGQDYFVIQEAVDNVAKRVNEQIDQGYKENQAWRINFNLPSATPAPTPAPPPKQKAVISDSALAFMKGTVNFGALRR